MTNSTLQLTSLPALRLAQASAEVNDVSEIPAVVGSLFQTVAGHLADAGIEVGTPGVRTYYGRPDGSKIDVAAGVPIEDRDRGGRRRHRGAADRRPTRRAAGGHGGPPWAGQ